MALLRSIFLEAALEVLVWGRGALYFYFYLYASLYRYLSRSLSLSLSL